MTRCIHCTRCVRFGEEVSGELELGVLSRGEHTSISTYISASVDSELSGNVVDLCPVGALTSKPFKFAACVGRKKQLPFKSLNFFIHAVKVILSYKPLTHLKQFIFFIGIGVKYSMFPLLFCRQTVVSFSSFNKLKLLYNKIDVF